MAEDGPAPFGFGAPGLYRTALAGFAIPIIITENLIIFLPGAVIGEFMTGRTEIAIVIRVIDKAIGIKVFIPGPVGIGLFGNIEGHPLTGTVL